MDTKRLSGPSPAQRSAHASSLNGFAHRSTHGLDWLERRRECVAVSPETISNLCLCPSGVVPESVCAVCKTTQTKVMAHKASTYFGMVVPQGGTQYSQRAPHFPKGTGTDQKVNDGLRSQFIEIVDSMIGSPGRMIPTLYGDVQRERKLVAKRNANGEMLVTAPTISQLSPEVRALNSTGRPPCIPSESRSANPWGAGLTIRTPQAQPWTLD